MIEKKYSTKLILFSIILVILIMSLSINLNTLKKEKAELRDAMILSEVKHRASDILELILFTRKLVEIANESQNDIIAISKEQQQVISTLTWYYSDIETFAGKVMPDVYKELIYFDSHFYNFRSVILNDLNGMKKNKLLEIKGVLEEAYGIFMNVGNYTVGSGSPYMRLDYKEEYIRGAANKIAEFSSRNF